MLPFLRKGFLPKDQKLFVNKINKVTGLAPKNIPVYILAFTHSSFLNLEDSNSDSNERLEFLGDAILDSVVAELLFKKFPFKNEGFLTEMRSRLVKRDTLNMIAEKIGLRELVSTGKGNVNNGSKSILGNALEALIGAVFLDYGYDKTKKFIDNRLVKPFIDIEELISTTDNYKSLILEWADKNNRKVYFDIVKIVKHKSYSDFTAQVRVNEKIKGKGVGRSKKKAEQVAAADACQKLKIKVG